MWGAKEVRRSADSIRAARLRRTTLSDDQMDSEAKQQRLSRPSAFAVRFIETYQARVGPELAVQCRFEPSCSAYAHAAYHKYGFIKATRKSLGRLTRCRKGYEGSLVDPP